MINNELLRLRYAKTDSITLVKACEVKQSIVLSRNLWSRFALFSSEILRDSQLLRSLTLHESLVRISEKSRDIIFNLRIAEATMPQSRDGTHQSGRVGEDNTHLNVMSEVSVGTVPSDCDLGFRQFGLEFAIVVNMWLVVCA
jgi:hypothetical protein